MPTADALRRAAAIPPGHQAAASPDRWVHTVAAHPAVQALRPGTQARVVALARLLARHGDLATGLTWPGHDRLLALLGAGWCRRTLLRWLRWLREHALLGHVEAGSTPQYRRGTDDAGNRAAVYLLLDAAPDASVTPRDSPTGRLNRPPARAPENHAANAAGGQEQETQADGLSDTSPLTTRRRRTWAADQLRRRVPALRRQRTSAIRGAIGPYCRAGACLRDLQRMLDEHPDGTPHRYATERSPIRSPIGWLTWRLAHWTDPDGTVLPTPRQSAQHRADTAHKRASAQIAYRHATQDARAAATPMPDTLRAFLAGIDARAARRRRARTAAPPTLTTG